MAAILARAAGVPPTITWRAVSVGMAAPLLGLAAMLLVVFAWLRRSGAAVDGMQFRR